jgi:signal transduction histidine kinase
MVRARGVTAEIGQMKPRDRADARQTGRRDVRGLEGRIVTVALLSTIGALTVAFSIYQWRNWSADREALAADSVMLARSMVQVAHRATARHDPDAAAAARALLNGNENAVSALYVETQGCRLVLSKPGRASPELKPADVSAPQSRFAFGGVRAHVPHYEDGRRVGELVLWADDRELVVQRLENIAIALALSLMATLGAGLVARRLARRTLRPLHALNASMEALAASRDFTARIPVAGEDEVGQLTHRFNRLLAALHDYDLNLKGALAEVTAARDAAEQANVMTTQFLANMGHELRTPLNGVLGMAQALGLDDLTGEQHERVEVIRTSGTALLTVLNDVLDLSEIESGRLRLEAAPFDLEALLRDACEVAITLAASKGIALTIEVDAGARGLWLGDPGRLRQVIYKLVSNGLKFTDAGEVKVGAAVTGSGLRFTVADTGIGIAQDLLPRLFGAFVQGEGGATRRFGGAGVGLAICRNLVELMGGAIEVDSRPGQGSVFTVHLPLARCEADADRGAAMNGADLGSLRVLVAEDNETNQRVVRTVLNALGIDPVVVTDGRAAVEAWGRGGFDLVLMDIQMPVRDGISATRDPRHPAAGSRARPVADPHRRAHRQRHAASGGGIRRRGHGRRGRQADHDRKAVRRPDGREPAQGGIERIDIQAAVGRRFIPFRVGRFWGNQDLPLSLGRKRTFRTAVTGGLRTLGLTTRRPTLTMKNRRSRPNARSSCLDCRALAPAASGCRPSVPQRGRPRGRASSQSAGSGDCPRRGGFPRGVPFEHRAARGNAGDGEGGALRSHATVSDRGGCCRLARRRGVGFRERWLSAGPSDLA